MQSRNSNQTTMVKPVSMPIQEAYNIWANIGPKTKIYKKNLLLGFMPKKCMRTKEWNLKWKL